MFYYIPPVSTVVTELPRQHFSSFRYRGEIHKDEVDSLCTKKKTHATLTVRRGVVIYVLGLFKWYIRRTRTQNAHTQCSFMLCFFMLHT